MMEYQILDTTPKMNRKGAVNAKVMGLIGALILVVMISAVAPTMFTGLNTTGGPTWVNTLLPVVVGAGVVILAWRSFS